VKIRPFSDLHLEFDSFLPPKVDADLVILAGDTYTGTRGIPWAKAAFPNIPVVYVLGNHEYYHREFPKLIAELKDRAKGSNIHVLENEAFVWQDFTFLGCTLWTDFALHGDTESALSLAQTQMNDYYRIRNATGQALRPEETRAAHLKSREWLENELTARKGEKVIVITHHVPTRKSASAEYLEDELSPAYISDLDEMILQHQPKLWIHGHTHHSVDHMIGETRIVANQRGYPFQSHTNFNDSLIIEV
jgi:Icc-related predicted phosphoesterase